MSRHVGRASRWVMVLGVAVGILVWGAGNLRVSAQQVNLQRAAVVQRYFAAQTAGDVDAALATFAENVVFSGNRVTGNCSAQTPCTDLASIRTQIQGNIAQGHLCAVVTSLEVVGSVVIGRYVVRNDAARARGIDRYVSMVFAQVPQDKMTQYVAVYDLTDAQTADNIAIQAGTQAPGAPLPTPDPPCPEAGSYSSLTQPGGPVARASERRVRATA